MSFAKRSYASIGSTGIICDTCGTGGAIALSYTVGVRDGVAGRLEVPVLGGDATPADGWQTFTSGLGVNGWSARVVWCGAGSDATRIEHRCPSC